jgi:hypothetical protein
MRWLGLTLLGILVAAAISIAASRLASQQIGLASQPISAGDALAPAASRVKPMHRHPGHRPANRQTKTSTEPSTIPSVPSTSSEPPTYSAPPSTAPTAPAAPPPESGRDGEHGGTAGGGADD